MRNETLRMMIVFMVVFFGYNVEQVEKVPRFYKELERNIWEK